MGMEVDIQSKRHRYRRTAKYLFILYKATNQMEKKLYQKHICNRGDILETSNLCCNSLLCNHGFKIRATFYSHKGTIFYMALRRFILNALFCRSIIYRYALCY